MILMKNSNTRNLVIAAMTACVYVVLTQIPGLSALSYGPVQFRVAEALCALPVLTPWAIAGLGVGCFISNLFSPMVFDVFFGTVATLIGAVLTYAFRKNRPLALLMPAISNGILIGLELSLFWAESSFSSALFASNAVTVAIGEIAVCYVLGLPLIKTIEKYKLI